MAYPFGVDPYDWSWTQRLRPRATEQPSTPYSYFGGVSPEDIDAQPSIWDSIADWGGSALHAVTYPFTLPKQGVDWLARTAARAQGLNVPDEATVGSMARAAWATPDEEKESYSAALGGRALEFAADVGLDPLTYTGFGALSKASKARGLAAKILQKQPGIALYAGRSMAPGKVSMLEALTGAVENPGVSSAVKKAATVLGVAPETIVKGQLAAERGLHTVFTGQMALGAGGSIYDAARRYAEEGFTPEVAGEALTGTLYGGLAGVGVYSHGKAKKAQVEALRRYRGIRPTEVQPVDRVPDDFQRDAEWWAKDLGEAMLQGHQDKVLAEMPEHLKPYEALIVEQAKLRAQETTGGQEFLAKVRDEHGKGAAGIVREERPDGLGWRLLQRDKDGEIVGAADVNEYGTLNNIVGGRAIGSKESVRPLYEELDKLGVEKPATAPLSSLGAFARRRGAEAKLGLPREVLEGRLTPKEMQEAQVRFKGEAEEAGLNDLVLGTAWAVKQKEEGKPFFSQLRRVVDDPKVQAAQRGADWHRLLSDPKRQIRASEMKWTGLDDYLKSRAGERVTKQEIQDYLDQNEFEVEEVVRGAKGPQPTLSTDDRTRLEHLEELYDAGDATREQIAERDRLIDLEAGDIHGIAPTKFEQHTLPGGTNYREVVIKKKARPSPAAIKLAAMRDELDAMQGREPLTPEDRERSRALAQQIREGAAAAPSREPAFTGGHFPEPDVLAHFRVKDDTGPAGEKVLRVEEIQSDWAQRGKREGFARSVGDKPIIVYARSNPAEPIASFSSGLEAEAYIREHDPSMARLEYADVSGGRAYGIPTAPFVTNTSDWVNLATKRILKYAVDNGYDKVSWTTGEQQAERYDLSKQISRIEYGADQQLKAYDLNGERALDEDVRPEKLADYIGKDAADKLLASPKLGIRDEGRDFYQQLEGIDLKVGGEGMEAFYDQIVPQAFGKLAKKFGGVVGKTTTMIPSRLDQWEYKYEGPEHSYNTIGAWLSDVRQGFDVPVDIIQQGVKVQDAVGLSRVPFEQAMLQYGSPALAEQLGGKMTRIDQPKPTELHSIDISPEMRETVKREGFPLFAVPKKGDKAGPAPAMTSLLTKLYPEGTKIKLTEYGYEVALPNKKVVYWKPGVDHIAIDLAEFEKGYGRKATPEEIEQGAIGAAHRLHGAAIVEIVEGQNIRVPLHEHWHVLKHLGNLTEKQLSKLAEKFKNEEEEADAFAEWWEKGQKTPDGIWQRVAKGIKTIYQALTGSHEAVFGEVTREALGAEAAKAAAEVRRGRAAGKERAGEVPAAQRVVPQVHQGQDLENYPATVEVDGRPRTFGAFKPAQDIARAYVEGSGRMYLPPKTYVKVDRERAARIAKAYEAMDDAPNDPQVKAAYDAMINETVEQFRAMLATGLKIEFMRPGQDPYGNPRHAIEDVVRNNHLWVFPTRAGFGSDETFDSSKNPLLADTEFTVGGQRMLANDVFRAVHDYFGHIKDGVGFRWDGEENAWRSHAAMYSPLARKAMTSETRGQNSWVNFGPHGEKNRKASPEDTVYANQKIGLLPDWVVNDGAADVAEGAAAAKNPWKPLWGELGPVGKQIRKVGTDEMRVAGAPEGVKNLSDFEALKQRVAGMATRGAVARPWYRKSSQLILDSVGGDKKSAERIAQLVAIYSPNTDVDMNFEAAMRAWGQFKAGAKEIHSGRYSAMDRKAENLLFKNQDWDGRKTNNFYGNLMLQIDPTNHSLKDLVTVDIHMMRALGYGKEAPGDAQYAWSEKLFKDVADDLGWDPHEVQAAVWTTQRYQREILDKLKPGEEPPPIASYDFSDAARDMAGHVNLEVVPHPSTGVLPELQGADYQTRKDYTEGLLRRVQFDAEGRDRIAALFDIPVFGGFFSPGYYKGVSEPGYRAETVLAAEQGGNAALLRHLGLGDWVITKNLKNAPKEINLSDGRAFQIDRKNQKIYINPAIGNARYKPAVVEAIKQLSGKDKAVDEYLSRARELDPHARQQMRKLAAGIGYVYRQEGVGFGRTFQAKKPTEANAYRINLGRKLTETETEQLMAAVAKELGTTVDHPSLKDIFPKTLTDGVVMVNFGNLDQAAFRGAVVRAGNETFGVDTIVNGGHAREVGDLVSNDWANKPNGEAYLAEAEGRSAGPERSRVLSGLQRLRAEADAYNQEFAAARGWGEPGRPRAGDTERTPARERGVAAEPAAPRGPPSTAFAVAQPAAAGAPGQPPLGRPMQPGEAPRVEKRVETLEDAINEQKKLGIKADNLVLSRAQRRTWESIDPEIKEALKVFDDQTYIRKVQDKEQLSDVEVQTLDAAVRGRREEKELARLEYQGAIGTATEAEARRKYAESLTNFVALERANVQDGTGTARALAARARIMQAGASMDRTFMRQVFREMPGVSDSDAAEMQRMFETGDPRLSDAIRAATAGRWKQWQTLLRSFLITPSSEIANTLGNSIVQGVEVADHAAAAGIDWVVSALRGTQRERHIGAVGAEIAGMAHAVPEAMNTFLKERFWDIYKRAWTGESKKIEAGKRRLEYQVSPFKSKLGRLFATSLDALQAGDELFQSPIAQGELMHRTWNMAEKKLGPGASRLALQAEALDIAADAVRNPENYGKLLADVKSATDRRLFRNKPWKPVEIVRQMSNRYPWLTAVLPFVKTPANIARYAIHHSPLGMLTPEFGRALNKLVRNEGEMTQGAAADIVAQRVVGTMIFGSAVMAGKMGQITGGGPADPNEKNALMETGWRPYSFRIETPGGGKVYVPFSRFDPVAQMFGVAADIVELKDTRDANDVASKAIGSIAENFTNRTYLKGLIDFTEALNDPLRFAGQYAANIGAMHIPRQVARIAQAIDPVMRDVRPSSRGVGGFMERIINTAQSNVPWLAENLPARYGPTGEQVVRPGEGIPGAVMRAFSPVQISPEKPGRNLEGMMAKIGYVPAKPKNVMTVRGQPVAISPKLLELVHQADKAAAYELRQLVGSAAFSRLPDTVEEGGSASKEGVMRKVYDKHRDIARRRIMQSYEFQREARETLTKAASAKAALGGAP